MTTVTTIELGALDKALRLLKLGGMLDTLDARLAQARAGELGHIDFLQVLCEDELSRRDTVAMQRRLRKARFEQQATLEGFDFGASPKLPAAQIRDLAALRWLHAGESVILLRPGWRREEPHRPGTRASGHPARRRRPLHQDQPRAGRAGWRARRRLLVAPPG
ncbi:ATP-binding protein [Nonomuraea sp. NPDC055795]